MRRARSGRQASGRRGAEKGQDRIGDEARRIEEGREGRRARGGTQPPARRAAGGRTSPACGRRRIAQARSGIGAYQQAWYR
ncbi:hypothetical protein ABW53_14355 [Stutzerimonas stutzeri]|nr:hypothetical protein ABW53_14355 [Stutzerimonas stutzeri]